MKNLIYCFLLFLSANLPAQQWLNCTNGLTVNDGVQQGEILWLATSGGLVKKNINSSESTIFNRGNSPIPSNHVHSVLIDKMDQVWLSTYKGAAMFDGTNWQIFYDKSGILELDTQDNVVLASIDSLHIWDGQGFESTQIESGFFYALTDIAINQTNNDIWLSYYTFGAYAIFQITAQGVNTFDHQNSALPFESPTSNPLLIDQQNRVWAGNAYGLYRYDGEEWVDISTIFPELPTGNFSALDIDENGNVWAAVKNFENDLLIKFSNDEVFEVYNLPNEIETYAQIPFLNISNMDDNSIYIGTSTNGLWQFNLSEWTQLNTSLSDDVSNQTYQIFIDNETTFIIGGRSVNSNGTTMSAISEDNWTIFDESNLPISITTDFPERIVEKYMDTLWFYTGDTLLSYINGNWSLPLLPDLLPDVNEQNSFIHHEPGGNRWLLEKYQSYIFYESDQGWLTFEHEEHGASSGIYESYFSYPQKEEFWLASANGISYYDSTGWTIIKPKDYGTASNWVYDMELDSDGVIWAVTSDAIINIKEYEFSIFTTQIEGITNSSFRSLTFDAQGRMWVGLDNTVAYLEGTEWVIFDNTNSGVPNGSITELEFDHAENLWIGSSQGGFAVFNENGLPDYLNPDIHTSVTSISNKDNSLLIYPNPISRNNVLKVKIKDSSSIQKQAYVELYDIEGQLLLKTPVQKPITYLPLATINTSGTYLLKLKTNTQIITSKVVIH